MKFELDAFPFRFRVPVRAGLLVRRLSGTKFQKGRALAMTFQNDFSGLAKCRW